MKRAFIVFGILFCFALIAFVILYALSGNAKRGKRPTIKPVIVAGVEFRVPNSVEKQGVVEAWDVSDGKLLWSKKVYHTIEVPLLEQDNQWNFISSLTAGASATELTIVNERGGVYILDTVAKSVRKVKGSFLTGW